MLPSIEESLKKLQLDYIDLFLVHSPVAFRRSVTEFTKIEEKGKLGYDESRVATVWQVYLSSLCYSVQTRFR